MTTMHSHQTARKTLVAALPSQEKSVLCAIKCGFAFSWGFANAIVYLLTSRFSTLMTGNVLVLAIETRHWAGEDLRFTSSLIIMYILGGAVYDALSIKFEHDGGRVLRVFALPTIVLMGVIADVMQFAMGSCSSISSSNSDTGESEEKCSGKYLYFLAPIGFLTGIVTSYLSAHPDGIIVNMVTGHMKVLPKSLLVRVIEGNKSSSNLIKGFTSAGITTTFFLGCVVGSFLFEFVMTSYSKGYFTPMFTIFSLIMATLCFLHYTFCDQFCFNYEIEQQMMEEMRKNVLMNKNPRGRKSNVVDEYRKSMLAAIGEVNERSRMSVQSELSVSIGVKRSDEQPE
eukprot:CAMPEP_0201611516 /NCGR_PEP_ID=MMETSP0492-20130828/20321_1 /ASSEMBLY_ACC=CAM_ASM_000837 /TAXON_ID=420259 /ORGANISM="Thalassiosira gravida, Strain GMp14c1" /LENGTH=340 /DNA_ID=CAMNT_0048077717 /DNA_START=16 /DNA_END=1038 /DNA_ORIENTATION=-